MTGEGVTVRDVTGASARLHRGSVMQWNSDHKRRGRTDPSSVPAVIASEPVTIVPDHSIRNTLILSAASRFAATARSSGLDSQRRPASAQVWATERRGDAG